MGKVIEIKTREALITLLRDKEQLSIGQKARWEWLKLDIERRQRAMIRKLARQS